MVCVYANFLYLSYSFVAAPLLLMERGKQIGLLGVVHESSAPIDCEFESWVQVQINATLRAESLFIFLSARRVNKRQTSNKCLALLSKAQAF